MMQSRLKTVIYTGLLAVNLAGVNALFADRSEGQVGYADFSRYQIILDRKPFGQPPPEPPAAKAEPPKKIEFFKDVRLCAITESDAGIRVGFIKDAKGKNPKSYFLWVGDSEDGIEVVDADYEMEAVLLKKDAEEAWLYLGGGPPTGGYAPAVETAAPKGDSEQALARESYRERLERRRAARHRKVEPPELTGEALEKHLREYQMDLIRKGMPPLPIPLTKEMDDQLVKEGVLPPME